MWSTNPEATGRLTWTTRSPARKTHGTWVSTTSTVGGRRGDASGRRNAVTGSSVTAPTLRAGGRVYPAAGQFQTSPARSATPNSGCSEPGTARRTQRPAFVVNRSR